MSLEIGCKPPMANSISVDSTQANSRTCRCTVNVMHLKGTTAGGLNTSAFVIEPTHAKMFVQHEPHFRSVSNHGCVVTHL